MYKGGRFLKKHFKAVALRYLDNDTVMKIREWRNQSFVKDMMYSQHDITEEEHRKYIASLMKDKNRGLFVFYLDNIPFGVYQYKIYPEGNYVMDGNYLIDQSYQDMGYGTIQTYFMSVIRFDYLHCHKSYGEIIDMNQKAIMLNKRLKVPLEGILRQHCLVNGEYHDVYCYGLLREEWEEGKEKIETLIYKLLDRKYEIIYN